MLLCLVKAGRVRWVQKEWVDLPGDIAFQAAGDFGLHFTFISTPMTGHDSHHDSFA